MSFAANGDEDYRDYISNYYVRNVEMQEFNILIDGKTFFDLSVKTEEEASEKIIEMNRNNEYTTGNLLIFTCFKENYRLIAVDLSI